MSAKIKFGTDGWRAIIAQDFNVHNVQRVSHATALWLLKNGTNPKIVIGHDCRFGGELFVQAATQVFLHHGIKVLKATTFISTPMISLAANHFNCDLGIVITASHNPPEYNGYKLKASFGGPLSPEKVQEIEDLIPDSLDINFDQISTNSAIEKGMIEEVDLETYYIEHVQKFFDLKSIQTCGLNFAYDAMYGAGQNVMKKLFPSIRFFHCEPNPSFYGQAPEPIAKNLKELEYHIQYDKNIDCALATDGDADRIGLYDGKGNFIDSHHIILLLIHYLVKYKNMTGKIVTAFSVTPRIQKMAEHYNLEHQTVKIGFKYVAQIMVDEDVLLGGEESGGIAVKGHIPERDGIWMGLIIWEYMAKSGKSLDELIQEVYEIVGPFKFERNDLHIREDQKQDIIRKCENNEYTKFGQYDVKRVETTDGYKFFFDDDRWVMIRPSGTEPVLRTYAEAPTMEEVRSILKMTEETIC